MRGNDNSNRAYKANMRAELWAQVMSTAALARRTHPMVRRGRSGFRALPVAFALFFVAGLAEGSAVALAADDCSKPVIVGVRGINESQYSASGKPNLGRPNQAVVDELIAYRWFADASKLFALGHIYPGGRWSFPKHALPASYYSSVGKGRAALVRLVATPLTHLGERSEGRMLSEMR